MTGCSMQACSFHFIGAAASTVMLLKEIESGGSRGTIDQFLGRDEAARLLRHLLAADVGACRCQLKRSAKPLEPGEFDKVIDRGHINFAGTPATQQVRDAGQLNTKRIPSKSGKKRFAHAGLSCRCEARVPLLLYGIALRASAGATIDLYCLCSIAACSLPRSSIDTLRQSLAVQDASGAVPLSLRPARHPLFGELHLRPCSLNDAGRHSSP